MKKHFLHTFVDLPKKENLPNEKAREYIEVLDRQSIGEYAERFEESKLEAILHTPPGRIVHPRRRQTYVARVRQPAHNIYKYSQKGTFHLSVDGDLFKVVIGFARVP